MTRRRIKPTDTLPLALTAEQRLLIIEATLAPEHLTDRLRLVAESRPRFAYTLGELDELQGYVAAEANHARDRALGRKLDAIFAKMQDLLDRYTDEDEPPRTGTPPEVQRSLEAIRATLANTAGGAGVAAKPSTPRAAPRRSPR